MVAFVDLVGAARKHERWQHALSVTQSPAVHGKTAVPY